MKDLDIQAIKDFDIKKHVYLEVVGKGDKAHLVAKKKGCCGRFWIWLGFGNASMKQIVKYLEKNHQAPLNDNLKENLGKKVFKYARKHPISQSLSDFFKSKAPLPPSPPISPRPKLPPAEAQKEIVPEKRKNVPPTEPPKRAILPLRDASPSKIESKTTSEEEKDVEAPPQMIAKKGTFKKFSLWDINPNSALNQDILDSFISTLDKNNSNNRFYHVIHLVGFTLDEMQRSPQTVLNKLKMIYGNDKMQEIIKLEDERIQCLEKEIEFSKRVESNNMGGLITLVDILNPWSSSGIRIKVLSNEELAQITLQDYFDLELVDSHAFLEVLQYKTCKAIEEVNTFAFVKEIRNLTVESLDNILPSLKGRLLSLLLDKQLKAMDTTKLSSEQIQDVSNWSSSIKNPIHIFTKKQIEDCLDKFSKRSIVLLSDAQIKDLDTKKLTKSQFDTLFNRNSSDESKHVIQLLSIDQMHGCLAHFESSTIRYLVELQIKGLDISKLDKAQFDGLFNRYNEGKIAIQHLSKAQIEGCLNHFDSSTIKFLSETQIKELDTSKLDKNQFDGLFNRYNEGKIAVQHLSKAQIDRCLNHFDSSTIRYLSERQIKELDTSRLTKVQFNGLFDRGSESKKAVQFLSKAQIDGCFKHFESTTIRFLSELQIKELDTSKLVKEQFNGLFNQGNAGKEAVQLLSKPQIEGCLKHFAASTLRYLSETQIKELDTSKLEQNQFNGLFDNSNAGKKAVQFLSVDQIRGCLERFNSTAKGYLSTLQKDGLKAAGITI